MLNFREQLQKDLDEVFFNLSAFEFAQIHKIAGIRGGVASPPFECTVIVDHELFVERRQSSKAEGVNLNGLLFFIKKDEYLEKFKALPKIESALQFDGEIYQVASLRDNMGVLEITLNGKRGR